MKSEDVELTIGDEIVWISDTQPEYGVVRWIGYLPVDDCSRDLMVGVEFENPIGSGNGRYKEFQLFHTPMKHASIVPIVGLMKASDFQAATSGISQLEKGSESDLAASGKTSRILKPRIYSELGDDLSNMSTFHKMAFDQLDTSNDPEVKKMISECHSYLDCVDAKLIQQPSKLSASRQSYRQSTVASRIRQQETDYRQPPIDVATPRSATARRSVTPNNKKTRATGPEGVPRSLNNAGDATGGAKVLNNCGALKNRGNFLYQEEKGDELTTINPLYEISKKQDICFSEMSDLMNNQSNREEAEDSRYKSTEGDGSQNREGESDTLDVGCMVEIQVQGVPRYGVIRWIGVIPQDSKQREVAGIEMEEEDINGTNGTFQGRRYFSCPPKKALFVSLHSCQRDTRFLESLSMMERRHSHVFGSIDCPSIPGNIPPVSQWEDVDALCGKYKGIQGHLNSCYLDATLFSMFAFTSVFDSLLYRPRCTSDLPEYSDVQRVLKEDVVNPLRKNLFVRADRVMRLRTMLENLSHVSGLTCEEKDPEEFLQCLLAQILKADPYLKLSSGQDTYLYQLFVDKDDRLVLPSVQQLFDQSFLTSDIKLREVPSCLIIQMPRFGKDYKMYPRIVPSILLDVTDVIEESPRQCIICGKVAEFECKQCFGQCGSGLESISFCQKCMDKVHTHSRRTTHASVRKLGVPAEFTDLQDHCTIPRLYMELFAVMCIQTSHYVSFVKCGSGLEASWVFFDSMADRKGEAHGYNIPEVVKCPDLPNWLSDDGTQHLLTIKEDRLLPEHAKRLLCDAYMCFYQSPDMMMYQ